MTQQQLDTPTTYLHEEALARNEMPRHARMREEAEDYYTLCKRGYELGLNFDAFDSPYATVAELRIAVRGS